MWLKSEGVSCAALSCRSACELQMCVAVQVWWRHVQGSEEHEWQASVASRCKLNRGCPLCARKPRKA